MLVYGVWVRLGPGSSNLLHCRTKVKTALKVANLFSSVFFLSRGIKRRQRKGEGGTVWCRAKALHVKPPFRSRLLHKSITEG